MALKLGPADLGWMLVVGAATLVANGTPMANPMPEGWASPLTYNVLQFGVPAVLLVRLADELVDTRRLPAWLAYPSAVISTILLGVWIIAPALYPVLGKADWWTSKEDFSLAGTSLVWHSLGMTVYVQQRYSRRAQARLEALQEAAAERERKLASAQLLALQARVDPAMLSERLAAIDTELVQQPPRALARLAALIDLLRALQPHVEAEVSTLAREIAALCAYAKLFGANAEHTERLQLAGPAEPQEWPRWPLTPMVLLPLVRPLLDEGTTLWSLSLHAELGRSELRLQALGPNPQSTWQATERVPLPELAQRLRAVHGEQATLELVNTAMPLFRLSWPIPPTTAP